MITIETLENLPAGPFGAQVTQTFGRRWTGSVESLNYQENTVGVYFWQTSELIDIHVNGLKLAR